MAIRRPPKIVLLCLCLAGVLLVGLGAGIAAADTYDVSVPNAIDTPSETVTFEGDDYEIGAFSVIHPDEDLPVDVTASDGTEYDVLVYNSEQQVDRFLDGTGSQQVTFETDDWGPLEPGTYSVNLEVDGATEAVYPVVVSGYDISTSHPSSATTDESATIDVTVAPTELDSDPADVELVIWNDDQVERITATSDGDDTYSATVSLDRFDAGTYNLHAAALGDDEFQGEQEILGLSDGGTLSISEAEDDSTGGNSGGTDDSQSDDSDGTESETDDSDTDEDATADDTESETDEETTDEETATETDDEAGETNDEDATTTDGETTADGDDGETESDDVTEPETPAETDDQSLSLGVVIAALVGALLIGATRRD